MGYGSRNSIRNAIELLDFLANFSLYVVDNKPFKTKMLKHPSCLKIKIILIPLGSLVSMNDLSYRKCM